MRETCFCGRSGELENREPVLDTRGYWLLRCPACGHLDDLGWLSEDAALLDSPAFPDRLRMELGEGPKTGGLETYGLSPYLVT